MQIGYCGLDGEPEHGAMPGAPVNGDASLDITVYCKGYVVWDLTAMFIQVCKHMQLPVCEMSVQYVIDLQPVCHSTSLMILVNSAAWPLHPDLRQFSICVLRNQV